MSSRTRYKIYRWHSLSIRADKKAVGLFFILTVLTAFIFLLSLCIGSYSVSPKQIFAVFFLEPDAMANFIVTDLRLPRVVAGFVAGLGFGLSGSVFQSLSRNPLAAPDIIGVTAGAASGAVASIILFGAKGLSVALGAVIGIFITTATIGLISWKKHFDPNRFVLVGIGIGITLFALIDYLLSRSDIMKAEDVYHWLIGSLNSTSSTEMTLGLVSAIPLCIAAFWASSALDKLNLGVDIAKSHGINVTKIRALTILLALTSTSIAVYITGPVAFIALAAGPITRQILGTGPAVFLSAIMGGFLLISADLLARVMFSPIELPVGLFTSILGGIFLIWMLIKQTQKGML